MIIALYGTDRLKIFETKKELTDRYLSKYGDLGLDRLNDGAAPEDLSALFARGSLFVSHRFIVVELSILKKADEAAWGSVLKAAPPETTVLVVAGEKLDQKSIKALGIDKAIECRAPEGKALHLWIKKRVQALGGTISDDAAELLLAQGETWWISTELEKLISHKAEITLRDVEVLSRFDAAPAVFDFVDALLHKNTKKALALFSTLTESENEMGVLALLAQKLRVAIIVKDLDQRGEGARVAERVKAHPFVIQKARQLTRFTLKELKTLFLLVAKTEKAVRTGELDARLGLRLLVFSGLLRSR